MLKTSIVRLRVAQRDLTPAQQTVVQSIENKLAAAEKALKGARDALEKWKKGGRYDPQKDYVGQEAKSLRAIGTAIFSLAQKL